ncbi:MAG: branched-chain amino acid ABC transporter permease [Acidimicrobiales bacterium]
MSASPGTALLGPEALRGAPFRDPYALTKRTRAASWSVLFAALIAFPLVFTNPAVTSVGVFTMMFLVAVVGWNIFSGYSGYVSIGHATFYGFGQYTVALLALHLKVPPGWDTFALLPLAGLVSAVIAIPLGWLLLRVRKHTFIVLTIAVMFIFQLLAFNFRSLTGGSQGLNVAPPTWRGSYFNVPFYYVGLVAALVALGTSWWVRRSKYGLGLLAVRDDEDRAKSLGIRVTATKLTAYVLSAFFVGVAGGIYAPFVGSVFPQFGFDPAYDLALAVMAFAGGLGTLSGPVLGVLVLEPLQQYFVLQFGAANLYLIVYGLLFAVILRFLPAGVIPSVNDRWRAWRAGRMRVAEAPAAPAAEHPPAPAAIAAEGGRTEW